MGRDVVRRRRRFNARGRELRARVARRPQRLQHRGGGRRARGGADEPAPPPPPEAEEEAAAAPEEEAPEAAAATAAEQPADDEPRRRPTCRPARRRRARVIVDMLLANASPKIAFDQENPKRPDSASFARPALQGGHVRRRRAGVGRFQEHGPHAGASPRTRCPVMVARDPDRDAHAVELGLS